LTGASFREKPPRAASIFIEPGAAVAAASVEAQSGEPFIERPTAYDAVLLLGFGGPEGQDDVIRFLRNVTRGRGIPDDRLEEVAHHYRHFGGISPINEQNRQLRTALVAELRDRGLQIPVYGGNRNWMPYVSDALENLHRDGHRTVLAIATSAYSSFSSCRQYREDLADALEVTGLGGIISVDKVRQYFDHPGFIAPFVDGLKDAVASLMIEDPDLDFERDVEVLFSTHSIPQADADRSGPPELRLGRGGAYVAQHRAVAETIMTRAGLPSPWQLVFQSRSGAPSVPWLEPDVNDAIRELPRRGRRAVIIVPVGFVSDHMEVMWDLDTEALETAQRVGLRAIRTSTPGCDPAYVAGLTDLIVERLNGTPRSGRPHETPIGPWFDVCRTGCCENARLGFGPAAAGVLP
jgi:ferrochelatase